MRQFLQQLMAEAEEWKAIKMVVLGHGRIGKTTLLHAINQIMDPSSVQVYYFMYITQNWNPALLHGVSATLLCSLR